MNAITGTIHGDLVENVAEFFAPMASDLVDSMMGEYGATRARLEHMAAAVSSEACRGVLHYFVEGNVKEERFTLPKTVGELFGLEGAVAQLNADFWNRALRLTDVLDYMPQKRRDEWFESIKNPAGKKAPKLDKYRLELGHVQKEWEIEPLPEFEEGTVRATLQGLLHNRSVFFSERVDGIFRSLSKEHVTNCPQGFNKRMILLRALTSYGTTDHSTSGVINDLRCVIAKFMGRDEPKYGATDAMIAAARRYNGQWMVLDGGALRIRIYNGVGTAHLEVHPDMAWRLNAVLASLYPAAIPAEFREKPKRTKKVKDFVLMDKPLPFAVVELLAKLDTAKRKKEVQFRDYWDPIPNSRKFPYTENKAALAQAESVLEAIGGVRDKLGENYNFWSFAYEPSEILDHIICSGCIPDHKSHQFYPTPESVGDAAIELADIQPGHTCLEPEAGIGGLADKMPQDATVVVEISELHCKVLEAKGYGDTLVCADFLKWAQTQDRVFDRIVMNPPFSEGRWQAHIEAASTLLADEGRLTAIIPASAKGKDVLPGFKLEWSKVYSNEFAGTSVSVVIMVATKIS